MSDQFDVVVIGAGPPGENAATVAIVGEVTLDRLWHAVPSFPTMSEIWLQPPLSCRELVELVTDYLDGSLRRRDRRGFERHVAVCGNCGRYIEQMRETIRVTGALREEDVGDAARDELMEAFRGWRAAR